MNSKQQTVRFAAVALVAITALARGLWAVQAQAQSESRTVRSDETAMEKESMKATMGDNTIHIVERPGYFETHGDIFQIEPGEYTFVVENRAGKDAGFVLAREGQEPIVIVVADGETGEVTVNLESGTYDYFWPIIPTAKYQVQVN